MIARALTCTAVAALVLAAGGTAAPAAGAPANGRIVFGYLGRLIQVNADGTGQWPLSAESLSYAPGDWSPDGTRLAIVSDGDIYTVDPRGRVRARLTFTPWVESSPAWSPDGSKILFTSNRFGPEQVWMMNADGSSPRLVTDAGVSARAPDWSPDGRRIVFASHRDRYSEISTADPDGSNERTLTRTTGYDGNPTWSPDGSRIAFESDRDGTVDVYTMQIDGFDVRQLTTSPAFDAFPEWSPDGTSIAFMSDRTGQRALYEMTADGLAQRQLSAFADTTSGPAWQPVPRDPRDASPWGPHCTIWGTPADDLLVGAPGNDTICGFAGDDRILGGGGRDLIAGEDGADSIIGGPGFDTIVGGAGDDLLDARDGELDSVVGGAGENTALVDRRVDDVVQVEREFDPDPGNLTRGRPVRASLSLPDRPAEYAVDGHVRLIWGALWAPAWIEVDLGRYATVGRIQLVVAQSPPVGRTLHVVLGKGSSGRWRRLTAFQGETRDGQVLRYTAPRPWKGIRWIRVVTPKSPSWVAWKEVQAYAPAS